MKYLIFFLFTFPAFASGIDSNAKLLLHADSGLSNSGTGTHTQTANGSAAVSSTQSKFGGGSLKFASSTSDWISSSDNADYDFGAGDFTIDYWVYQTSTATPVVHVARKQTGTYPPFLIGYGGSTIYMSSNGTSWDMASGKTIGATVLNTWSHIEVCRSGNTFYTFRDGVQKDTWTSSASFPAGGAALAIGSGQGANYMNGYIDELRITKGLCRHTAAFTPPTAAYAQEVPESSGYGTLLDSATASNDDYIDLIDPFAEERVCEHYLIEFFNVVSDIETPPNAQSGALLTAYVSTDNGSTFDTGAHYNNTGVSNFQGEANPNYAAPFALGTPQTLNMGLRLSVDTGDRATYGATGVADIFFTGGHTIYTSKSYKGGIGGTANMIRPSGTFPTSQVGYAWFPSNGTSPFHWSIQVDYAGHYDGAQGEAPNAFRFKMDGGGTTGAKIEAGKFKLRCMD